MSDTMTLFCWVLGDEIQQFFVVEIPNTKSVATLKDAIKTKKSPQLDHLPADALTLWKVSIPLGVADTRLPDFKPENPSNGGVKLSPGDDLIEVFPDGAPRKHIHIIVQAPVQPVEPPVACGPLSDEAMRREISTFIEKFSSSVDAILSGEKTVPKFRSTDIPEAFDRPFLSLYRLGETPEMEAHVKQVFSGSSESTLLFINTSGSGKTRLLLEGLCKHWGFYFTCVREREELGSRDLSEGLENIGRDPAFKSEVTLSDDNHPNRSDQSNRNIVRRHVIAVLVSRFIALATFRKRAESINVAETEQKRLWLLLQVLPTELLLLGDMFYTFSGILCQASQQYLSRVLSEYRGQLIAGGMKAAFTAVDEAQMATKMYRTSFVSRCGRRFRPVLSELIASIDEVWGPIIVSGTGLQKDMVESNVLSASVKHQSTNCCQETGSFHVREDQAAYITQCLWPDKQPEELPHEAQRLLRRAWQWLRGRYRTTSSFIELSLLHPSVDPNEVLNHFFRHVSGFWPIDDNEGDKQVCVRMTHRYRPIITDSMVEKLEQDHNLFSMLLHCFMDFVVSGTMKYRDKQAKSLVEIGVAFFCNDNEGTISTIKEPVAVYSLVNFFKTHGQTVSDYLNNQFISARGTSYGHVFEEIIAWNFFAAFSSGHKLNSVFHFCGTPPLWAAEGARLLAINREGDAVHSTTITAQCALPFGYKAKNENEVLQWATDPKTIPILFPDNHCGPDIFMVLETVETKQRINVSVQGKCTINGEIPYDKALATVDPTKLYMVNRTKDCKTWKSASNLNAEFRGRLKSLNCEMTPTNTLRVLATLPSRFEEAKAHVKAEGPYPIVALLQPSFIQQSDFGPIVRFAEECAQRIPEPQATDDIAPKPKRQKRRRGVATPSSTTKLSAASLPLRRSPRSSTQRQSSTPGRAP